LLLKLSISKRLWLFSLFILCVFICTFFFFFNFTIEQNLREGFLRKGISLVQTAAINIGPALYTNDPGSLSNILKGLETDPDITLAVLVNTQNQLQYKYGTFPDSRTIENFSESNALFEYANNYLLVRQSVFYKDNYQADLIVGFHLNWIKEKINEQRKFLIILTIGLLILQFILVSLMVKAISSPLKQTVTAIREYSNKNGALALHLPVKGNDEISQLSKALNDLSDNLNTHILALNQSKRYLETIFQLNPIPIIIADTLGQIETANESACSFFGIQRDLFTQMKLENFIQKEDLHTIFNRIIEERQDVRNYVTTLEMIDGQKKVVELSVASHVDEGDIIKNIIITAIDITEKIQIQREILQNQSKLQRINKELTQKTEELARLSELNQKNASNLAKLIETTQQMMRSLDTNEILKTMLDNGCQLLEAEIGLIYIYDKNKNEFYPSHTFPKQYMVNLVEKVTIGNHFLWKTFSDNEPILLDSAQLSREEMKIAGITDKKSYSLISVPISEKDYHLGVLVYFRNKKQPFRVEEVHLLSTLVTETAILLDNKNLVKALEEKAQSLENAYSELQRSQQQVIQLQKMESLGTLVGGIAHDFNNILGIILPNTDLIKSEANGHPTLLRRATVIAEATQRAAELTRQLLMFSRNQDIQLQIISPNQLVTRLSGMLQRTLGKEYDILLDLDPKIEDIEGDENRLSQVLINLALNSRDSMPNGGEITIRTRMCKYKPHSDPQSLARDYVCISVTDSGCGIKPSDLDKIFDPFFTTKSVGKGTGLGLSVVYGIMQSHRGFVEVESEVNEGTTFYLYLPPARRKLSLETEDSSQNIPEGSESILIVDDEELIRDSVKDILQSLGYAVFQASSGPEAIRLLEQKKYKIHLVIIDMSMPRMNGVETIRKIREIDKRIKVLLSSGHPEKEKSIPDDLLINGLLPKPYRMRELALKIRQVLNQKS